MVSLSEKRPSHPNEGEKRASQSDSDGAVVARESENDFGYGVSR